MNDVAPIDFQRMNAVLTGMLAEVQKDPKDPQDMGMSGAGAGGAHNESDILAAVDKYMTGLANALVAKYELDEDEAYDFMFDVMDAAAAMGQVSELPEDDAADAEFAQWLASAQAAKLDALIMQAAAKQLS